MSETERVEATRIVAAPPSAIFSVLVRPRHHVNIDSSMTLQRADESPDVTAVGDSFVIDMLVEGYDPYQMQNTITVYEENRALEWQPVRVGRRPGGYVYGYVLEPIGDSTRVTSYYDWSQVTQRWRDAGFKPVTDEARLRTTIDRLATLVESSG